MERLLGAAEHYFWLHDQVVPVHFVLIARIRGNFSLEQLRKSLTQLQLQHPLLRVAIAVAETGHPKFVEQIAPIPLRLMRREDEHGWQREVEIELSRSFDWRTAPLIRVVLLHSESVSELIVTCHHAIADGLSSAFIIWNGFERQIRGNRVILQRYSNLVYRLVEAGIPLASVLRQKLERRG